VSLSRNFFTSLASVVLGNAIYFLIMPHLPLAAQHQWKQIDLGLIVDFWICLALYGVMSFFLRSHSAHPTSEQRR